MIAFGYYIVHCGTGNVTDVDIMIIDKKKTPNVRYKIILTKSNLSN